MSSLWVLRRVVLVKIDVSVVPSTSIIRVTSCVRRFLVAANVVPSSPILVILMMEAPGSSESSVLTRVSRCNISEDVILHSHSRENLKSYMASTVWPLKERRNVSPLRYELGFISQKTAFLRVTAVETSSLTCSVDSLA
jgi:hypothetical protein